MLFNNKLHYVVVIIAAAFHSWQCFTRVNQVFIYYKVMATKFPWVFRGTEMNWKLRTFLLRKTHAPTITVSNDSVVMGKRLHQSQFLWLCERRRACAIEKSSRSMQVIICSA